MVTKEIRTVEDSLCTIQDLLVKSEYVIGDYQRTYQWKPKDIKNLLNDILDKRTPIDNAHFIGLLITHRGATSGGEFITHRIIDGQQRITTLMLLFCAIELEARKVKITKTNKNVHANLVTQIKKQVVLESGEPRLKSQDPDQNREIREIVFESASSLNPYKKRLNNCRMLVRKRLENKITMAKLNNIFKALISCKVLLLQSETIKNPYTVFTTINNRGQDLEPADLFKSLTIDLCESDAIRKDALDLWREIRSGQTNNDIRYWNVLRTGTKPSPQNSFETIQGTFTQNCKPGKSSLKLLGEIKNICMGLHSMRLFDIQSIKKTYKNATWAKEHIKYAFNELKIRETLPLFYASLSKCNGPTFEKVVLTTVRVSLRILKAKTEANRSLPPVFQKFSHKFWTKGNSAYQGYKKAMQDLVDKHCDDEKFEEVINGLAYETDKSTIRHLLIGIDESTAWLSKGTGNHIAMIDKSKVIVTEAVSLEHISPQALDQEYVHSIGNITLMGADPNSYAGDDPMENKAYLLENSPYQMTQELVNIVEWGNEAILERQNQIIERAKKVFNPI